MSYSKALGSNDDNGSQHTEIPLFIKKTYAMVNDCDSNIAGWTYDGGMLVIKYPTRFASEVVPKYFDHNKFESFTRQLNFYSFRKIQPKAIKSKDMEKSTLNHVRFCNDNFKRDRKDLLCNIKRKTRKGWDSDNTQGQERQIDILKAEVVSYRQEIMQLKDRMQSMEANFLGLVQRLNLNRSIPDQLFLTEKARGSIDLNKVAHEFAFTSLQLIPDRNISNSLPIHRSTPNLFHTTSQPTILPHVKTNNGLTPGSMPPLRQLDPSHVPVRNTTTGISRRGLSNESNVCRTLMDIDDDKRYWENFGFDGELEAEKSDAHPQYEAGHNESGSNAVFGAT